MLLWAPGGFEGQKLHLWLAASCQFAQSDGACEGGGTFFGIAAKIFAIMFSPKITTARNEPSKLSAMDLVLKVNAGRMRGKHEEEERAKMKRGRGEGGEERKRLS